MTPPRGEKLVQYLTSWLEMQDFPPIKMVVGDDGSLVSLKVPHNTAVKIERHLIKIGIPLGREPGFKWTHYHERPDVSHDLLVYP